MALPVLVPLLGALVGAGLPYEFDTAVGWTPQPSYLPNPAAGAEALVHGGVAVLRVTAVGRGMKFRLDFGGSSVRQEDFLVLRYRARGLAYGYALHAEPGGKLLDVADLRQDGQWHTLALDLYALGVRRPLVALLTEVQCAGELAEIAFDWIRTTPDLPEGAHVYPPGSPGTGEHVVELSRLAALDPKPTWLGSPADEFGCEPRGIDGLHLWAEGASRGMKFGGALPEPVDLSAYRYAAIRYRATGTEPWGDYALWLSDEASGEAQQWAQPMGLADVRADGEWHTHVARLTANFVATHLALQVSSASGRGDVWISAIRFCATRPRLSVGDLLPFRAGWQGIRLSPGRFVTLDLGPEAQAPADEVTGLLHLANWLPGGPIQVNGIPFRVPSTDGPLLASGEDIERMVSVRVGAKGTEAYLLLVSRLPALAYGEPGIEPGPMTRTDQPERFTVRVEYADGLLDDVFPLRVASGTFELLDGASAYGIPALRDVPIRRIALRNRMDSARFWLAAVTLNQGPPQLGEPPALALPAPPDPEREVPLPEPARISSRGPVWTLHAGELRLSLRIGDGIRLVDVRNGYMSPRSLCSSPSPIFELGDGTRTLTSAHVSTEEPRVHTGPGGVVLTVPFDAREAGIAANGQLVVAAVETGGICLFLTVQHTGDRPWTPQIGFPLIGPLTTDRAADDWYLWCRKGGLVSNQETHQRQAYGGAYPLQVADFFRPSGGGLALMTQDQAGSHRDWDLTKDGRGVRFGLSTWAREYGAGEHVEIAPAFLIAHPGDWRAALRLYRRWAQTWYQPQVPRKPWFQGCFYYQQQYAWTGLRDESGRWQMSPVINRYRDYFGCLDYLHIFDFGESRVYGRVGDYTHYDELGGLEAMRDAIAEAQGQGVRVGVYIEGYLCDERGIWGREHVPANEIKRADGTGLLWAPDSTEHMMCPAAEGWRSHLAETYQRVARELRPDGMYIDQYGFTDAWKTCWSREHGHPVPAAPIAGERGTLGAIRAATPPEVATLTEETPNDVSSQYQDGALGYSVWSADAELAPHRVDLFRFAFPSFKVFQLVTYEPYLEGGWHLLKYPFFNGEGYWLAGGTTETYCEDGHQFLKRAFAILHEHADAFTSDDVEPLVPTLEPTVYANRFRAGRKTVWTLMNGRHRTFRGELLRLPATPGLAYWDAFAGRRLSPRIADGRAVISLELGPRAVGCVVAQPAN